MNFIFIYLIPLLIIGVGIYLSFFSDAIKDISSLKPKPYSFSRTQLMWWTLIILSCFSVSYGWHHTVPALNGYILAILGIGTGTATLANLIDKSDIASGKPRSQDNTTMPSRGFLFDILDDGNGISVHRFQALIFNMVLGIVFISQFFQTKIIPEFKDYELGLLGISSGAYLALKANENK